MKKSYLCTIVGASLLVATSYVRAEEPYALPVEIANPEALQEPQGSGGLQSVVGSSFATSKPSTDLPSVDKLSPASTASPAVNSITSALSRNSSISEHVPQEELIKNGQIDVNKQAEVNRFDEFGRPINSPAVAQAKRDDPRNKVIEEAKKRYQTEQKVNVPPNGNIILPISRGLQNRIQTSFKSASVSTSAKKEDASIFVEDGAVYITTNVDNLIGIMLSEEGVPESTYNLTLVPLEVPGAMISVNTSISPSMAAKREKLEDEKEYQALLEKSQSSELEDTSYKQDDHKQRILNILTPVALGEVPSGFSMQIERLNRIPQSEQSPCGFNMYAKLGQRLIGAREIIDVILVSNDKSYGQIVPDQQCIQEGVIASALFEKAYLQPGEKTELYIVRDKLYQERKARVTTRPNLIQ